MKKFLHKSFVFILVFLQLFAFCACEQLKKEEAYKLSSEEEKLVNTIYSCRNIWEKHNGKPCINVRYVEKNGYQFFLCSYSGGKSGGNFMGNDGVYTSIEIKYTISGKSMHEARLTEYGSSDHGLVTGLFAYDTSANAEEKKLSIAKAITNKSYVVVPGAN